MTSAAVPRPSTSSTQEMLVAGSSKPLCFEIRRLASAMTSCTNALRYDLSAKKRLRQEPPVASSAYRKDYESAMRTMHVSTHRTWSRGPLCLLTVSPLTSSLCFASVRTCVITLHQAPFYCAASHPCPVLPLLHGDSAFFFKCTPFDCTSYRNKFILAPNQ
jgi:hypothetical protein